MENDHKSINIEILKALKAELLSNEEKRTELRSKLDAYRQKTYRLRKLINQLKEHENATNETKF